MSRINLTPIFEQVFGTSEIKTPERLQLLIDTLEEMGDEPLEIEELAEKIQAKLKS